MESKGEKVSYFWLTPRELIEFRRVIREEADPKPKKNIKSSLYDWDDFSNRNSELKNKAGYNTM